MKFNYIWKRLYYLSTYWPNKKFIIEGNHTITCIEFFTKIKACVIKLDSLGITKNDRIGILLPKSIDTIILINAILSLGAVYIPIDINNPIGRVKFIIKDARIKYLLCNGSIDNLKSIVNIIDANLFSTLVDHKETNFYKFVSNFKDKNSENLFAILYTSGSTGNPKGIAINYKSVISFIKSMRHTFNIKHRDIILSTTPLTFDLSLFDIIIILITGSTLVIAPQDYIKFPTLLTSYMIKEQVSVCYAVPSLLKLMLAFGGLQKKKLDKLRTILFAGEIFRIEDVRKLVILLPGAKFFNLFGPTETNVNCFWEIDKKRLKFMKELPIGKGFGECEIKIDHKSNELLYRGKQLMSGYIIDGSPKLKLSIDGWFNTGDSVVKENEEYRFTGRLNSIIKKYGYRIEPKEIEDKIINFSKLIKDCIVIGIQEIEFDETSIVAFLTATKKLNLLQLKAYLSQNLPAYMQVDNFIKLNAFPRLNNGKVNFKKLKEFYYVK